MTVGVDIIDHLHRFILAQWHGIICPYNAIHTNEYCAEAMQEFHTGNVQILVCTDTASIVSFLMVDSILTLANLLY